MANSSINLTSLDFDTLKSNLKSYLKSQSTFKDYDFDGSNMNVLLDILSYNTYLNSFYLNMAISESFLDTAQLRDSVISHAKELNYTPYSSKSPEAKVDITFNTSGINSGLFEIPKGTPFSGTNSNGSFIFTTDQNLIVSSTSNTFVFSNVSIYEGTYINESYVMDYTIDNQRFILSNPTIDTNSLTVQVIENTGANVSLFTQAGKIYDLTNTSNVYFLQATSGNQYEIVFGDGVFGRKPLSGSTVLATYRVTRGTAGGGIKNFLLDRDLGGYNGGNAISTVVTSIYASDGAMEENIESIRFRAPRSYQSQDRAVTVNDYKTLILDNFPDIEDVNVYGGETAPNNTKYGTVFISPSTYSGAHLSSERQTDLLNFLSTKKIINIRNEIVEPEYVYVIVNTTATINFSSTSLTTAQITTIINNTIKSYNDVNLKKFNDVLRLSTLISSINNSDPSVISNQVSLQIYKDFSPELGSAQTVTINLNNPLQPGTITSTPFLSSDGNSYILTDYSPKNDTFIRDNNITQYIVINKKPIIYLKQITTNNIENYLVVGSVDYSSGIITVKNLNVIEVLTSPGIRVTASPSAGDVFSKFNNIVEIDTGNINTTVIPYR